MNTYIPFDLGTWTARGEPWICPRHGKQHGGLLVMASPQPGEIITRKCCGVCVIDALDKLAALKEPE